MHFRRFRRLPFPVFALIFFAIAACIGCSKHYLELDKLKKDEIWDPTWAVPLAHSIITSYDILDRFDDDSLIVIDPITGLLALRYSSEVFSVSAEEFIVIPSQNNPAIPVPMGPTTINDVETNGSATITIGDTLPITTGGEKLETITFKDSTRFEYSLFSDVDYAGTLTVSIPDLKDAGGASYSSTVPFTVNESNVGIDKLDLLDGYTWDLTMGGTTTDSFAIFFSITYINGPGTAAPTDILTIDMDLNGVEFRNLTGDIGSPFISTGIDSVRLRIYENATQGQIRYSAPKLIAVFTNTFGAALEITPAVFKASSPVNGATALQDLGSGLGEGVSTQIIASPSMGVPGITTITMDSTNSNLNALLQLSPERIVYDVDVQANPGGGTNSNFVMDTSKLKLDVIAELPLDGWAKGFTKSDTVVYGIPNDSAVSDSTAKELVALTVRLNIDNGFPTDGKVQVYFADSNNTVVDSLFGSGMEFVFLGGIADGTGRVVTHTLKTTDMVIPREKLIALRDSGADRIIVVGEVQTTDAQTGKFVKIFEDYTMELWLGIKAEFEIRMDTRI